MKLNYEKKTKEHKQVRILAYAHALENMPLLNCKFHSL